MDNYSYSHDLELANKLHNLAIKIETTYLLLLCGANYTVDLESLYHAPSKSYMIPCPNCKSIAMFDFGIKPPTKEALAYKITCTDCGHENYIIIYRNYIHVRKDYKISLEQWMKGISIGKS